VIFLIILVIFLVVAGLTATGVYFYMRSSLREQKNYERALKMVPLLIHLPPQSDDTEVGSRDQRDVTDETISKAQTIYNIVGSTLQKGFKARFYGQRHFGFEIVGSQGFVYFYASVPVTMVDVVQQAVVSAYPTAQLEEVAEHNIFNQVGKINATIGGELNLKESYAYPIATYQDLKRDAMQSVLNSLATLDKEDGAGIQILLRPANPSWRKKASSLASKKRKGEDKKGGAAQFGKQLLMAPIKAPEEKKDGGGNKKELSNLEQATLDAIDDKTRHQGYEVQIRLIASSNISQRSQAILRNMVASFSLFDAPGRNGFKFTPAKDIDSFVTSYIMRFFPQKHTDNILNSVELATLFHFPDQKDMPTSQVTRQESKQVDGPRNVPDDGLLLGYNMFRGAKKPIRIGLEDRQRHIYVVGQTGTGKSTLLENLAFQDMVSGNGFAFVDPHGDTAEKLLLMIPRERTEDVIYFSPADMDYPMGLNLFEFQNPDQKDFLIQETLNMLYKLYDPQHQGIMGPRYEDMFRNAALVIMADPNGGTFVDIPKLFRDPQFLKQKIQHVKDQSVLDFWLKQYPASQRSNESGEVTAWFVSKFGAFLSNEMMRNIIGQTKSAFDLRDIMDNKKILLVNLSKGRLGDMNAKLLGMIFVMKFQAAAMSRANILEEERVDFSLYVDEFQNFSTDSFATIMSEARKYHLNLIVGNQFTTQLTPEIRDAVFGNIGTIVSFRIGQNDVESLGKYFQPTFDSDDLLRVPNRNTIIRTLINGVPTQPFSMATLPPFGNPNPKLGEALKQLSAAKYGRPRALVEAEIFERMATKPEAKPAFGAAPAAASPWQPAASANVPPTSAYQLPPKPAAAGSSFLDDWLTKRQSSTASASAPTPLATVPAQAPVLNQPATPQPTPVPVAAAPGFGEPAANPYMPASPPPPPTLPTPQTAPSVTDLLASSSTSALPDQVDQPVSLSASPGRPATPQLVAIEPKAAPESGSLSTDYPDELPLPTQVGQNISSDELERNEVDRIARELKQHLADTTGPIRAAGTQSELSQEQGAPEDTIFIDHDGNLRQKGDDL
jgi:hypothetical protein